MAVDATRYRVEAQLGPLTNEEWEYFAYSISQSASATKGRSTVSQGLDYWGGRDNKSWYNMAGLALDVYVNPGRATVQMSGSPDPRQEGKTEEQSRADLHQQFAYYFLVEPHLSQEGGTRLTTKYNAQGENIWTAFSTEVSGGNVIARIKSQYDPNDGFLFSMPLASSLSSRDSIKSALGDPEVRKNVRAWSEGGGWDAWSALQPETVHDGKHGSTSVFNLTDHPLSTPANSWNNPYNPDREESTNAEVGQYFNGMTAGQGGGVYDFGSSYMKEPPEPWTQEENPYPSALLDKGWKWNEDGSLLISPDGGNYYAKGKGDESIGVVEDFHKWKENNSNAKKQVETTPNNWMLEHANNLMAYANRDKLGGEFDGPPTLTPEQEAQYEARKKQDIQDLIDANWIRVVDKDGNPVAEGEPGRYEFRDGWSQQLAEDSPLYNHEDRGATVDGAVPSGFMPRHSEGYEPSAGNLTWEEHARSEISAKYERILKEPIPEDALAELMAMHAGPDGEFNTADDKEVPYDEFILRGRQPLPHPAKEWGGTEVLEESGWIQMSDGVWVAPNGTYQGTDGEFYEHPEWSPHTPESGFDSPTLVTVGENGGISRQRPQLPADFDPQVYFDLYPDLRENGITTREEAATHYLTIGKAEGRSYLRSETESGKLKDITKTDPTNPNADQKKEDTMALVLGDEGYVLQEGDDPTKAFGYKPPADGSGKDFVDETLGTTNIVKQETVQNRGTSPIKNFIKSMWGDDVFESLGMKQDLEAAENYDALNVVLSQLQARDANTMALLSSRLKSGMAYFDLNKTPEQLSAIINAKPYTITEAEYEAGIDADAAALRTWTTIETEQDKEIATVNAEITAGTKTQADLDKVIGSHFTKAEWSRALNRLPPATRTEMGITAPALKPTTQNPAWDENLSIWQYDQVTGETVKKRPGVLKEVFGQQELDVVNAIQDWADTARYTSDTYSERQADIKSRMKTAGLDGNVLEEQTGDVMDSLFGDVLYDKQGNMLAGDAVGANPRVKAIKDSHGKVIGHKAIDDNLATIVANHEANKVKTLGEIDDLEAGSYNVHKDRSTDHALAVGDTSGISNALDQGIADKSAALFGGAIKPNARPIFNLGNGTSNATSVDSQGQVRQQTVTAEGGQRITAGDATRGTGKFKTYKAGDVIPKGSKIGDFVKDTNGDFVEEIETVPTDTSIKTTTEPIDTSINAQPGTTTSSNFSWKDPAGVTFTGSMDDYNSWNQTNIASGNPYYKNSSGGQTFFNPDDPSQQNNRHASQRAGGNSLTGIAGGTKSLDQIANSGDTYFNPAETETEPEVSTLPKLPSQDNKILTIPDAEFNLLSEEKTAQDDRLKGVLAANRSAFDDSRGAALNSGVHAGNLASAQGTELSALENRVDQQETTNLGSLNKERLASSGLTGAELDMYRGQERRVDDIFTEEQARADLEKENIERRLREARAGALLGSDNRSAGAVTRSLLGGEMTASREHAEASTEARIARAERLKDILPEMAKYNESKRALELQNAESEIRDDAAEKRLQQTSDATTDVLKAQAKLDTAAKVETLVDKKGDLDVSATDAVLTDKATIADPYAYAKLTESEQFLDFVSEKNQARLEKEKMNYESNAESLRLLAEMPTMQDLQISQKNRWLSMADEHRANAESQLQTKLQNLGSINAFRANILSKDPQSDEAKYGISNIASFLGLLQAMGYGTGETNAALSYSTYTPNTQEGLALASAVQKQDGLERDAWSLLNMFLPSESNVELPDGEQ